MSATEPATLAAEPVIPVSVATLLPETVPGVALYIEMCREGMYAARDEYRLYRGPGFPVTADDLANLRKRGITTVYVSAVEHRQYQDYLRQNLNRVLDDESVPAVRRVSCLNEVVRDILSDIFRWGDLDQRMEDLQQLGRQTVRAICKGDVVLNELRGVLYHDYHTFTHSANVAFYCVVLAQSLGITDQDELSAIATGGLLHDAGKLDIPNSILTKPGALDDDERRIMRRHPRLGFSKLCRRNDLSQGQLLMVYQHHERLDGHGYPVRATARELHEWGRICAVADVFEALTSNRPYRAGLSYRTACEIMQKESGAAFDRDFLKCWLEIVEKR